MNDDLQIKMFIHTQNFKTMQQYKHARKFKFDSLSFDMLERLGFFISPP